MQPSYAGKKAPASWLGQRRHGFSRGGPIAALVGLALAGVLAVGASPIGPGGASGSFQLGPGDLPAGEAGGVALNLTPDGQQAELRMWATPGVGTYFLDVLEFRVTTERSVEVQVGAVLSSPLATLPEGGELLAVLGTPATSGAQGGSLASAPAVEGGSLLGIEGLGGEEGELPGMSVGLDIGAAGTTHWGSLAPVTLGLSSGSVYVLVLSVAVLLPSSDPGAMSSTAFTVVISLSSPS